MKNKKNHTLKSMFNRAFLYGAILLALLVASIVLLAFIPSFDPVGPYVTGAISITLLVVFLLYVILSMRKLYHFFYGNLYETTSYNLSQIAKHQNTLALYSATNVEETNYLNRQIDLINVDLSTTSMKTIRTDYSRIPLVYLDEERKVVDHHTFHLYFEQIIACSPSYRNVLLCLSYPFNQSKIQPEERMIIIRALKKAFANYYGLLISETKDEMGYYVYLPIIDSFSLIKEEIESLMRELSLLRPNEEGLTTSLAPQFTLVCYPYSTINNLFGDIAYARRMGLPMNFYLPNRLDPLPVDKNRLSTTSMDLNTMSKILSTVSSLNSLTREEDANNILRATFQEIMDYFHIDLGGIVLYQDKEDQFRCSLIVNNTKEAVSTKEGDIVDKDIALTAAASADSDNTYYASDRKHVVRAMGRFFDHLGYTAGFFYVVYDENNKPYAEFFFLNKSHDLLLSSYLRESLRLYCNKVGDYLLSLLWQRIYNVSSRMASQILKLTHKAVYGIENDSYSLTMISDGLKAIYSKAQRGDLCYKAFYGSDSPCADCPLSSPSKMLSDMGPWHCETSLTLADINDKRQRFLLVEKVSDIKEMTDDLFDKDWFTNTFYSLIRSLKGQYATSGRGYLLLLRIDNITELVGKYGSEKVSLSIRSFANALAELDHAPNVYTYKPDTLALLYDEMGQTDIITQCEKIYDLTRVSYFEDKKTLFQVTYLPISYPQGYPDAPSFVKHTEVFYSSGTYKTDKNFIYLDESTYSRSADKNAFMLSVIEEKFSAKKDFQVLLQPVVEGKERKIVSAELLLRLRDDYRKSYFNTTELIQIAAKNGKIGLISDALLNYIGGLYEKYGLTIFRVFGFDSLSLNTDYEYLADPDFLPKVTDFIKKTHITKNFLGFEVNEDDVFAHYEEMKRYLNTISQLPVRLICDRYTGKHLSLEQLEELGFNAFKVDRFFTGKIDTDRVKYNAVKSLLEDSRGERLQPILLGVENPQQAKLITDIRPDVKMQGYAFYHPLEEDDLIAAIRAKNAAFRSTNTNK